MEKAELEFTGTFTQCMHLIGACIESNVSPLVWGIPGVGKSQAFKQVCDRLGRGIVEIRVAQIEPVDLRGIPQIREYTNGLSTTQFAPPDELPLVGREDAFDKKGVLLFEEINLGESSNDVRSASFQFLDQRRLGSAYLLPDWVPAAIGNPTEYNIMAVELAQPLKNRFAHIFMPTPTVDEWTEWAIKHDVDPRITAFHKSSIAAGLLCQFKPGEYAYPTPRSWEMASKLIKNSQARNDDTKSNIFRMLSATVGTPAAVQFSTFIDLVHKCPTVAEILRSPKTTALPDSQPGLWAVVATLIAETKKEDFDPVLTYLRRVDEEAQAPELSIYAIQHLFEKWQGLPRDARNHGEWLGRFKEWVGVK